MHVDWITLWVVACFLLFIGGSCLGVVGFVLYMGWRLYRHLM